MKSIAVTDHAIGVGVAIPFPDTVVVEAMVVVVLTELVDVVEVEEEPVATAGMEELEVDEFSKLICTQ